MSNPDIDKPTLQATLTFDDGLTAKFYDDRNVLLRDAGHEVVILTERQLNAIATLRAQL